MLAKVSAWVIGLVGLVVGVVALVRPRWSYEIVQRLNTVTYAPPRRLSVETGLRIFGAFMILLALLLAFYAVR